jgi:hypothetical protein
MNQNARRRFSSLLRWTLLAAAAACGETSGPSGPGQLQITLHSGNTKCPADRSFRNGKATRLVLSSYSMIRERSFSPLTLRMSANDPL